MKKEIRQKERFVVIAWILTLSFGIMIGLCIYTKEILCFIIGITIIIASITIEIILLINTVKEKTDSIGKGRESPDTFYAMLLKDFKKNFKDDCEYNGKYIKLLIDNLLKRI